MNVKTRISIRFCLPTKYYVVGFPARRQRRPWYKFWVWDLVVMNMDGYTYRFVYPTLVEAKTALGYWLAGELTKRSEPCRAWLPLTRQSPQLRRIKWTPTTSPSGLLGVRCEFQLGEDRGFNLHRCYTIRMVLEQRDFNAFVQSVMQSIFAEAEKVK
jgi:hypothetical protein